MLLQRLNTSHPIPYGLSDFGNEEQWASYRAAELKSLSDMTLDLLKVDPKRERDRSDHSHADLSIEGLSLETRNLTFVPVDPREAYRQLLRACLNDDLQLLRSLPEDQDVSLGILSAPHAALLAECALRWRLPLSFRSWVFLEAIQEHYEQGEVPPDCVFEAVANVGRASQDLPVSDWATVDQQSLQAALLRRDVFFLNDIEECLESAGYLSLDFRQAVVQWNNLNVDNDEHTALQRTQRAICDRLRQQAYSNYIDEASERYSLEGGKNRRFALGLATWIESCAKRMDKWFKLPLTTYVNCTSFTDLQPN